jgi:uncharacterized protein YjiS (DUF1127 family)
MSAIADHHSSLLPASRPFPTRLIGGLAQGTLAAVRVWRARLRQRRELLMLNNIELCDLSLSEADVNREARKSFWETIQLTRR